MSDVVVSIGADASDFTSSIGGMLSGLTEGLASINPAVAAAVGIVAGIGVAAFNVGKEFDAAFDAISSGTGATGESLAGLQEDFRAVFANVPDDAAAVGSAIADLNTRTGATGPILQGLATQYLNLAELGDSFTLSIEAGSEAFKLWGVNTEDQSGKLDFLFKASQALGPSVAEITELITKQGAGLQELGFSFEESAVLAGKLQAETGNAGPILKSLTLSIKEAGEAGIPAREHLESIVSSIKNTAEGAPLAESAFEAFGGQTVKMAEAIRSGRFDIDDLVTSLAGSEGAISGQIKTTRDFGEQFGILSNKVSLALEPLGLFLVDGLTAIASFLVDNFNPAMEFMGQLWGDLVTFMQPAIDNFKNNMLPALTDIYTIFIGFHAFIRDSLIVVLQALWGVLQPLFEAMWNIYVPAITKLWEGIKTLTGWLKELPGVSALFQRGQEEINKVVGAFGTEADTAKGKTDALTGSIDTSRIAQEKVGAAGSGSAPRMAAAIRDTGAAADAAAEKLDRQFTAAIIALAVEENIAAEKTAALAGQAGALQTAFENVEQPVIDVGGAVSSVNNSVLAATTSMANADVASSLEQWKTDAEAQLPAVAGVFETWGSEVSGIVNGLGSDMFVGMFAGEFSLETVKGALSSIRDSFADALSKPVMDLLTGPEGFITKGLKLVTDELDTIIGKLIGSGGVKDSIGSAFGSTPVPGGGGPSVPGGAPGGGSGGGGGGAASGGGLMGTIGVVSGVVSAVSGVIGNFQFAGMNKSLDIIVKHTLQTVNLLGGEGQDGGISLKLKMIEDGVWYGPGVKAIEDFRNKWFDFGLPVFRSLEVQGAYVQPTLSDISTHGVWIVERLDKIISNTERTAVAVERMATGGGNNGVTGPLTLDDLANNRGGSATELDRIMRSR